MKKNDQSKLAPASDVHGERQTNLAGKRKQVVLSTHMNIEQAFVAIAISCMTQIQTNADRLALTYEVESVHQMRIGLRRLNAAFNIFKNILRLPDNLHQEIRWLSALLGAARDWDVFLYTTLPAIRESMAKHGDEQDCFAKLTAAVTTKAHEKHQIVLVNIRSSRYAHLISGIMKWINERAWRAIMRASTQHLLEQHIEKFAHRLLLHRQRSLLKKGKRLAKGSSQELHCIRIATKKTRYATEFFASLHAEKRHGKHMIKEIAEYNRYIEALSCLQDSLGSFNDAAIADKLLKELSNEQADLTSDIASVKRHLMSIGVDKQKIHAVWKKIIHTKYKLKS